MIYSLSGELIHIENGVAVIECSGVGFACRTTANSLSGLKVGDKVVFKTHMNVREDAIELFGFITEHELNCFKMLTSVSGVGPKYALAVLSHMSPQDFAIAVVGNDVKSLTKVKGIGTKTAQLLILKLKDKLEKSGDFKDFDIGGNPSFNNSGGNGGDNSMAINALLVLGFTSGEAAMALSELPAEMETSEKIKEALKRLSRGGDKFPR